MAGVSIQNLTRGTARVAGLPFASAARAVLPRHEISLAFVTPAKAQALNKQLRNKTYVPNVLSYALDKSSGEIIICPAEAKKQAPTYDMPVRTFILYLFIHGLLHIKGMAHSATMERSERRLLAKFVTSRARSLPTNGTTHSNRNRHRHLPGEGRRRRGTR